MEIRIRINQKNAPRPDECWMAELEYDNKPVKKASPEALMMAVDFCRKSPFADNKNNQNMNIKFWDFSSCQVRKQKTDCNEEVIYKLDYETKTKLKLFVFGLVSTAGKFNDIQIVAEYVGSIAGLKTFMDAKNFIDNIGAVAAEY